MTHTLDRLLGNAGTGKLLEHLSERRRLHIRRERLGSAAELLPWTAFDGLMAGDSVRPERFKVMLRNREVERSMYREPGSGALRSDTLMTMAAQGASLVVNVICDVAAPVGELAAAIGRQLDRNVLVNCYASFGDRSALEIHADDHDVLVVQVHGAKHWRCFGVGDAPEWDGVIEEGDVLFVPQGDRHAVVPVRRPSVHLSFAIGRSTPTDTVRAARELRRVAAFGIDERLAPSLPLVPALRRRIDLRLDEPGEVELHIGGRPVRLALLARVVLHTIIENDRMEFAALAAALDRAPEALELRDAVCELARKGLIGIGA